MMKVGTTGKIVVPTGVQKEAEATRRNKFLHIKFVCTEHGNTIEELNGNKKFVCHHLGASTKTP